MVQMGSVVIFTMLVVHPTFMLTRGKRWARTFLRHFNHVVVLTSATVLVMSLWTQHPLHTGMSAFGLALALLAFAFYRTEGFDNTCSHFEKIRDDLRARQSGQKGQKP